MVRAAWAVTTAAASFTWSDLGHQPDDPYRSTQAFVTYPAATKAIDVLNRVMTEDLPAFERTSPADALLGKPVPGLTFCLAERGEQYIVYSDAGVPFTLDTTHPTHPAGASVSVHTGAGEGGLNLTWIDPVSGDSQPGGSVQHGPAVKLVPPVAGRHWVAMLLLAANP